MPVRTRNKASAMIRRTPKNDDLFDCVMDHIDGHRLQIYPVKGSKELGWSLVTIEGAALKLFFQYDADHELDLVGIKLLPN